MLCPCPKSFSLPLRPCWWPRSLLPKTQLPMRAPRFRSGAEGRHPADRAARCDHRRCRRRSRAHDHSSRRQHSHRRDCRSATFRQPLSRESAWRDFRENGSGKLASCMIVVATDAPLDALNLKRLAARALLGVARPGVQPQTAAEITRSHSPRRRRCESMPMTKH